MQVCGFFRILTLLFIKTSGTFMSFMTFKDGSHAGQRRFINEKHK
jgi:hypothetical protein